MPRGAFTGAEHESSADLLRPFEGCCVQVFMNESTRSGLETGAPKMHVSLDTADLSLSVQFYTKVFGVEPAKLRSDWAKFELESPALVFSLNAVPTRQPAGRLSHLGMRLGSHAALAAVQERLQQAGVAMQEQTQTSCCYALQDKIWVQDPDGNAFEFYVLVADVDVSDSGMGAKDRRPDDMKSCCVEVEPVASSPKVSGSCSPGCC